MPEKVINRLNVTKLAQFSLQCNHVVHTLHIISGSSYKLKWDSMPYHRTVCLRHYTIHTSVHAGLDMTLTSDLWPLTLKIFTAITTHTMNICVMFHSSTKQRDIALWKIGVNEQRMDRQPDKQPKNIMPLLPIVGRGINDHFTGFLLLYRIHFPWLFQTKWIIFPD